MKTSMRVSPGLCCAPSNRQIKLWLGLRVFLESGQRDSKKPDRLWNRYLVLKQCNRQAFEVAVTRNRDRYRPAAGDDLEVVELHLQGHGPTPRAFVVAVPPDLVDQRL